MQAESYAERKEWIDVIQGAIADTVLGSGGGAPPRLQNVPSKESAEDLGAERPAGRVRQVTMPSGHRPPRGR